MEVDTGPLDSWMNMFLYKQLLVHFHDDFQVRVVEGNAYHAYSVLKAAVIVEGMVSWWSCQNRLASFSATNVTSNLSWFNHGSLMEGAPGISSLPRVAQTHTHTETPIIYIYIILYIYIS